MPRKEHLETVRLAAQSDDPTELYRTPNVIFRVTGSRFCGHWDEDTRLAMARLRPLLAEVGLNLEEHPTTDEVNPSGRVMRAGHAHAHADIQEILLQYLRRRPDGFTYEEFAATCYRAETRGTPADRRRAVNKARSVLHSRVTAGLLVRRYTPDGRQVLVAPDSLAAREYPAEKPLLGEDVVEALEAGPATLEELLDRLGVSRDPGPRDVARMTYVRRLQRMHRLDGSVWWRYRNPDPNAKRFVKPQREYYLAYKAKPKLASEVPTPRERGPLADAEEVLEC